MERKLLEMSEALAKVKSEAEREIEETQKASAGEARAQSEQAKRREEVGIACITPHHFPWSFGADGTGKSSNSLSRYGRVAGSRSP